MFVLVVDKNRKPLNPCHPARARKFLKSGRAAVLRRYPSRQEFPKTHWLDAACVGKSTPDKLQVLIDKPLTITSTGHGTRQMCRTDKYGFPVRYVPRNKFVKGFQTGDIVKAIVTKGKKIGAYIGRVAVRTTGSFNVSTVNALVQGINHKYCSHVHGKDGYRYSF
ncbi:RRXRR domain-containing protein [Coleofasciculus sp. G3-WIS-01]|uniref:RRXRR domain-containing protein n=1 Tax=Coleofasciculus sp. G3-WIS-01 TaxID=3069528 RepID=UPI0040631288